ncbi:MAG: efflux transporter outer membrane subunit [Deltaproteobacteria bacterium]|nr:efflux transporter outer membrane subunit [Deltaproteobacteria bacterium]
MKRSALRAVAIAGSIACLCALAAVQGCAVGPDYQRPQIDSPAAWTAGTSEQAPRGGEAAGAQHDAALQQSWWRGFCDDDLAALVERAVRATPRAREAAARVREARALRAVAGAGLWPKLDATASYSNSRMSEHGFLEGFGTGTNTGGGTLPGAVLPGQSIDLYQTGFDAQWEVDLFGHVRRSVQAANAELQAAEAAYGDALLSLAAETAREVITLRTLDARLAIAKHNMAAQADTLSVIRQRHDAGVSSELDVARAQARLAATEADVPALRSRRSATMHRLEVLVAADSGALDRQFEAAHEVPTPPRLVEAGLPSQLLLRRPDLGRAERELAAATARIGVARAELLPRFSLSGSFGFQSQQTGNLLTSDSRFWLVGPGMRWPIFDAGRLLANVEVHSARTEQAAARYEDAVRRALADVETALTALGSERERTEALGRAAEAEKRGADLARELFAGGVVEFLQVLDAERSLYYAEDALASSRGAVAEDAVALYKALAGGWPTADTSPRPQ